MARCTNCNYKWNTKNVWLLGFSKKGKECPNCNTKQFVSFKDKGLILSLGYISGVIGLLLIIFFPFFIKLSDKDETLF